MEPGQRSVPDRFSLVWMQRHRMLGNRGTQSLHLRADVFKFDLPPEANHIETVKFAKGDRKIE